MEMSLFFLLFVFVIVYAVMVTVFLLGWERTSGKATAARKHNYLSVLVAARNEAKNIERCLRSLSGQDYPFCDFEVIVVDDHSDDNTYDIVKELKEELQNVNLRLIRLSGYEVSGKKHAINMAVKIARGDYIVTTDADCIFNRHWLATINNWLEEQKPGMLIGPVLLWPAENFFGKMQVLEFFSLSGSTAGAAGVNQPVMCNGANLVYKKEAFLRLGSYDGNYEYASGDDVFLLHKFKKEKEKIIFLRDENAIVSTKPVKGFFPFLGQRERWASKTPAYKDLFTILVALIVAAANILLAIFILRELFCFSGFQHLILLFLLKSIPDFVLLWKVSGFFSQRKLMWIFPLVSVLYPFYISTMFFLSAVSALSGKRRRKNYSSSSSTV